MKDKTVRLSPDHGLIRLSPLPRGTAEFLLLLLAILPRAAATLWLALDPARAFLAGDGHEYWALSESLLTDGTLNFPEFGLLRTPFTRTPGYPLFLAAIRALCPGGDNAELLGIACVQGLLSAWTLLLAYRMAIRIWSDAPTHRVAILFALYALDLGAATFGCLLMSETLFTFLWILSGALLLPALCASYSHPSWPRLWLTLLATLLLAGAALVRPIGQLLVLPVLPAVAWTFHRCHGIRWSACATLLGLAVFSLPLTGWSIRNAALGGPFALSSVPSVNMLLYAEEVESPSSPGPEIWARVHQKAEQMLATTDSPKAWFRAMAIHGRERLLSDPPRLISAVLRGCLQTAISPPYAVLPFLGWPDEQIKPLSSPADLVEGFRNQPALSLVRLAAMLVSALLCTLALASFLTQRRIWSAPWLLTLLGWTAMHTLLSALSGGGRMRIPIQAWIFIFAAGMLISGFRLKPICCVMQARSEP